MTPKQTIEKMSSTQQYSPRISRSCINGVEDFQRTGKRVALKEGQTTELNKRILKDRTLRYQGRPAMFIKF